MLTARRFGAITLFVLAVHVLLLRGAHDALIASQNLAAPPAAPALRVRTMWPATTGPGEPSVAPAAATAAVVSPAVAAPVRVSQLAPERPRKAAPLGDSTPTPVASARADSAGPAGDEPAEEPAAPLSGDLPVYRTRPPPAFAFAYTLQRGSLSGIGELQWRPQGEQYQARLEASSAGGPLLAWNSAGGFDAAGLAPARYTDSRRGRAAQAANFQRGAGRVSFSGPAIEHALPPGAQDRLSWMLQLAAIAAAEPSLVGPGGRVSLLVFGARGDADVWTFVHAAQEALALPEGSTPTLRLLREPRRPYDTRVEVWLDPARHYLPVRARLSNGSDAQALQLMLREVLLAP